MINNFKMSACALFLSLAGFAQEVEFTEYDLDNGLHVILHQDNTAPVVSVGVMYHVGAKDEEEGRSGFAHFFEHLLFEGSENIEDEENPEGAGSTEGVKGAEGAEGAKSADEEGIGGAEGAGG